MASKNKILGANKPEEEIEEVGTEAKVEEATPEAIESVEEKEEQLPCFLYHESSPRGKLFSNRDDLNVAIAQGWKDSPAKI